MSKTLTREQRVNMAREFDDNRGPFKPDTPSGKTRFEMQNRGPMRPGKTRKDHRSGAWTNRFANRRARQEA